MCFPRGPSASAAAGQRSGGPRRVSPDTRGTSPRTRARIGGAAGRAIRLRPAAGGRPLPPRGRAGGAGSPFRGEAARPDPGAGPGRLGRPEERAMKSRRGSTLALVLCLYLALATVLLAAV